MASVVLDFDPPVRDAPGFRGPADDLVYFLSWAYSSRYGAQHELALAALALRQELRIDLRPLLTFADREVEEPADEEALERAWQDPAPLAECCERVAEALAGDDPRFVEVRWRYPALVPRLRELAANATRAGRRGARMRVTYTLGGAG